MNGKDPITLAVLAGGAGSRMGEPKSRLTIAGRPALAHLLRRLNWIGPTLLVTAPSNRHPPGAEAFLREISDPADGGGPAQGLLTALRAASTNRLILMPVDMPLVTHEQLQEIADAPNQSGAPILGMMCTRRAGETTLIEPFPGIYDRALAPALENLLRQNRRSLHGLRDLPGVQTFDASHWPDETWINLNTPQDLRRFQDEFVSRL